LITNQPGTDINERIVREYLTQGGGSRKLVEKYSISTLKEKGLYLPAGDAGIC